MPCGRDRDYTELTRQGYRNEDVGMGSDESEFMTMPENAMQKMKSGNAWEGQRDDGGFDSVMRMKPYDEAQARMTERPCPCHTRPGSPHEAPHSSTITHVQVHVLQLQHTGDFDFAEVAEAQERRRGDNEPIACGDSMP